MVPEMKFYNVKGQEVRPPKNYGFRPAVYGMLIEEGKLLFIKPVWDDRYSLPGGAVELGEELTESLAREFLEETGYFVDVESQPIYVDTQLFNDSEMNKKWQRINLYFLVKRNSEEQSEDLDVESEKVIWKNVVELSSEDFTFFQRRFLTTVLKN
jgi:ADP-ribose pyrophosphatase YjhB (NUDIX family)